MLEGVIALAVIVILLAGTRVAGNAESRFVQESARRDAVRDAAAALLEKSRAHPASLATGTSAIPLRRFPGGSAERTVRAVAPGLLEVVVTVQNEGAECTLTTLIATETPR